MRVFSIKVIPPALGLCAALTFSGCGVGIVAVVLGIRDLSNDEAGSANLPPARPEFKEISRVDGEHVVVTYTLLDDDGGPLDVLAAWQAIDGQGEELLPYTSASEPNGPEASPAGNADPGDGLHDLMLEPNTPRTFRLVWDARRDLLRSPLRRSVARVRLRLIALDGASGSEPALSDLFVAGNEPPKILGLEPKANSGVIPIEVTIADSTSDAVDLECYWRDGEGVSRRPMTLVGSSIPVHVETRPEGEGAASGGGGKVSTVFWDSRADLGATANSRVRLEVIARDYRTEPPAELSVGPILVDNNAEPQVQLLDLSRPEDKSFEIPIRFIVRDEDEHPVDVVLQWASGTEPFPELPLPASPSEADRALFESILSSEEPALLQRRRELHILSEAAKSLSGLVDPPGDLPQDQVRITDLVRAGLVFAPPAETSSRDLPAAPFSPSSGVFLTRQVIRFRQGQSEPGPWRTIVGFDPRVSVVSLDGPAGIEPGARYELRIRGGLARLASSREGLLHTFIWDSARDMKESGTDPASTIRIRAVGIDSQVGPPSPQSLINLQSTAFKQARNLITLPRPQLAAVGDVNGDGRNDVVIPHEIEEAQFGAPVGIYLQDPSGELPANPSQTLPGDPWSYQANFGDLNGDGTNDLVVASCGRLRVFYLKGSDGKLNSLADFEITENGNCLLLTAIGDFNGDGLDDLVVTWNGSPFGADLFLQQEPRGSGLAGKPSMHLQGDQDTAPVAIGDLDGDGDTDIVLGHRGANLVGVYSQEAGGTFDATADFKIETGNFPGGLAVGDLNDDGRSDLVVTYGGSDDSSVGLFFQEESPRRLPPEPQLILTAESFPLFCAVSDFNGDGRSDLAVGNLFANSISVYFQKLQGNSPLPGHADLTLPTEEVPYLTHGDVNGDGRADLLTTNTNAATVTVYVQNSPGLLPGSATVSLAVDGSPHSLALGDLNGDGRDDIVTANFTSSSLSVFSGGPFGLPAPVPDRVLATGRQPRSVAIGDLDGDGRNDIAVANFGADSVGIYRQGPGGALATSPILLAESARPYALAIGDLNGDGRNDLAVANLDAKEVSVHLQDSAGVLSGDRLQIPVRDRPHDLCIGDLNGDGLRDLAVALRDTNRVIVILQGTAESLAAAESKELLPQPSPIALAIGDLNGDGRNDLAVAEFESDSVVLFLQDHQGVLPVKPSQTIPTGAGPLWIAIAEANGDGRNDLAVSNFTAGTVSLYLQKGSGTFPNRADQVFLGLLGPGTVAMGDLNGDGRNDLLVPNRQKAGTGPYSLGVYLGR